MDMNPGSSLIRPLVEQLYETEGLTDALSDEAATLLLHWGEQQLTQLALFHLAQTQLDQAATALQQAMRAVNRLIEQRADLSDTEIVEQLLRLINQVIALTVIAQQARPQEQIDDQEETNLAEIES
jgi:hypothetical protein